MPELRKDPLSDIWVIFSPERKLRPLVNPSAGEDVLGPGNCPFCEGNESMTPPEIDAVRDNRHEANQPGWRVRVIPNKYPALRAEGHLVKESEGFYDKISGIGAHEVVIETTSHSKGIDRLETEAVTAILLTYKRRILDLKRDPRFRYIQVFKNHGVQAGASLFHPHSQVVAMPVVPARVKERLIHAETHFNTKNRCFFCDMIHDDARQRKRVVAESNDYIVISPYAARLPYELAIYPRAHGAFFEETAAEKLHTLAVVLKDTMIKINKVLERPSYSLILYNAPLGRVYADYFHWHLEIVPFVLGANGFALGTHAYINPILPEEAAAILNPRE
jgi:UDPglucose--hexose-1-phosphate uridylyltransferase